MKHTHEIRDPIHTFVRLDSDERKVLDSRPLQRLRHIQQLAMSNLVYPGATHKRFEHSLGVMELAGRVFDVITSDENIRRHDSVSEIVPLRDLDKYRYWRRILRMAALCHDVGHLPFSHAAERELLPEGWNHERLTVKIIRSSEMEKIWESMEPPLKSRDIVKLAIGQEKCEKLVTANGLPSDATHFSDWETILAEVIIGDAFGVDRMDYLLRDSYHAGVAYGRFDHYRLIDTLRILPKKYEGQSQEPALGVEEGGLHSAEALLLARYFMYTQVYFHCVSRIYEVHLKDFLAEWLKGEGESGKFPTAPDQHLDITDHEIMAAIWKAARDTGLPGHEPARRIVERDHYRLIYQRNPEDTRVNPSAAEDVFLAASKKFGDQFVRRDSFPAKDAGVDFPVLKKDGDVASSRTMSEVIRKIPPAGFDYVFIDPRLEDTAKKWLKDEKDTIIKPKDQEKSDETDAT